MLTDNPTLRYTTEATERKQVSIDQWSRLHLTVGLVVRWWLTLKCRMDQLSRLHTEVDRECAGGESAKLGDSGWGWGLGMAFGFQFMIY